MALTKISTDTIADDAVTAAKIAAGTIVASDVADDAITLAKMAGGTDGQIITYDASGDPVAVGPGTDGQVLTSTGAGSPPAFEAVAQLTDNSVTLAKMAGGTDGQIITYDASGDPVAVGPGTDGQVLTSTGAGSPPAFEAASGGATTAGFAVGLTTQLNNVTGGGQQYSWNTAIWGELYDAGSNFANGTFTAPVTGKYIFVLHFYTNAITSSHTMCQTQLTTSNRTYTSSKFNPYNFATGSSGSDLGFQDTIIADLDACDTAYITAKFENGAQTVDYYSSGSAGTTYNYFVGALVNE